MGARSTLPKINVEARGGPDVEDSNPTGGPFRFNVDLQGLPGLRVKANVNVGYKLQA